MQDPDSSNTSGRSDRVQDILAEASRLMASAELELEAKGYSPGIIQVALERALGTARFRSSDISPSIQDRAFLDILTAEIGRAEGWATKMLAALNAPSSNNLEQEGGDNK